MIRGLGRSPGEGIGYPLQYSWASLGAQLVKNLPTMQETWVQYLGWEDPLEKGKATHSNSGLETSMDYTVHGILQARILEGVASLSLQRIFPTQVLNPGLLQCRRIFYQLSHKGRPRILKGITYPFSSRSSPPRNQNKYQIIFK